MKRSESPSIQIDVLLIFLLAYAAASLFHHVHNAELLTEYPKMPAWLSRASVYIAWLCVTSVGLIGYVLVRWGYQLAGLFAWGVYGALGLDGIAHRGIPGMNATAVVRRAPWPPALTARKLYPRAGQVKALPHLTMARLVSIFSCSPG